MLLAAHCGYQISQRFRKLPLRICRTFETGQRLRDFLEVNRILRPRWPRVVHGLSSSRVDPRCALRLLQERQSELRYILFRGVWIVQRRDQVCADFHLLLPNLIQHGPKFFYVGRCLGNTDYLRFFPSHAASGEQPSYTDLFAVNPLKGVL